MEKVKTYLILFLIAILIFTGLLFQDRCDSLKNSKEKIDKIEMEIKQQEEIANSLRLSYMQLLSYYYAVDKDYKIEIDRLGKEKSKILEKYNIDISEYKSMLERAQSKPESQFESLWGYCEKELKVSQDYIGTLQQYVYDRNQMFEDAIEQLDSCMLSRKEDLKFIKDLQSRLPKKFEAAIRTSIEMNAVSLRRDGFRFFDWRINMLKFELSWTYWRFRMPRLKLFR